MDELERLQAETAALREALEHSTSALEYIADELRELGEDGDANMMKRQAQENNVILATDAGREMLERLAGAERDEAWALLRLAKIFSKVRSAVRGGID